MYICSFEQLHKLRENAIRSKLLVLSHDHLSLFGLHKQFSLRSLVQQIGWEYYSKRTCWPLRSDDKKADRLAWWHSQLFRYSWSDSFLWCIIVERGKFGRNRSLSWVFLLAYLWVFTCDILLLESYISFSSPDAFYGPRLGFVGKSWTLRWRCRQKCSNGWPARVGFHFKL